MSKETMNEIVTLYRSIAGKCRDQVESEFEDLKTLVETVIEDEEAGWHDKASAKRSVELIEGHFEWLDILGVCEVETQEPEVPELPEEPEPEPVDPDLLDESEEASDDQEVEDTELE